jgi:exodeoxyribonuclease VII large subunit
VGHEPDVTISDFVADLRAATPSNAAELAVPDQDALRQNLDTMSMAMVTALDRQIRSGERHLKILSGSPALQSPTAYLDQKGKSLQLLQNRLTAAQSRNVERKYTRFVGNVSKLDALSPLKVLTRGYALVRDGEGEVLKSIRQVQPGDRITVSLSDGKLGAVVTEREETL